MLAGVRCCRSLGVVTLAVLSVLWAIDVDAGPSHGSRRHHGHAHGSGVAIFPSFAVAVGPGVLPVAPVSAVGVGLGVGVGYYPFSVGVGLALPGSPPDPRGSLRVDVPQRDAEVFIDGYYAGIVDDFDGSFQSLRLQPGPHVVSLYLDGYRLYEESVNSTPGTAIKIRHEMEPLEPGEPVPPRPSTVTVSSSPPPASASAYAAAVTPTAPAPPSPTPPSTSPSTAGGSSEYGVLSIRTQPAGVGVWIDGELWEFPTDADRLSVHLPVGAHDLRLSKEGYADFQLGVELAPGETNALNVRLSPAP